MATGAVSQPATGDQTIDGLLGGFKWNSLNVLYNFPTSAAYYPANYNSNFNELAAFAPLAENLKTIVRSAFGHFSTVCNLTFTEVGASDPSNTSVARTSNTGGFNGLGYGPGSSAVAGDVWFNSSLMEAPASEVLGRGIWHLVLHELGHAMGLKHGHETNGYGAVPSAFDFNDYTQMSYRRYESGPTTNANTTEAVGRPQTLMMLDIAALQTMYGANYNTQSGNTVYSWNPTTGQMSIDGVAQTAPAGNRIYMTVWDGNGTDTYDLSNYTTNLSIDLTPGGKSIFSDAQLAIVDTATNRKATGNVFNALLFNNDERSLIENATGGSGNDIITGNSAGNLLSGGAGNDYLDGGARSDHLWGGAGADYIVGGSDFDYARYDYATSGVYARLDTGLGYSGEAAGDIFASIEGLIGSAYSDMLVGDNLLGNVLVGGGGDDALYGLGGNDTLIGDAGIDFLDGGADGDYLDGGAGFDFARYDYAGGVDVRLYNSSLNTGEAAGDSFVGVEGVVGSWYGDTIYGDGGSNQLHGLGGDDWLDGVGAGDYLFGGDGNDNIVSRDGGDKFDGGVGWDNVRYDYATSGVAAVLYNSSLNAGWAAGDTYSSIEGLVGSAFGDDLRGDAGVNALLGQGGNDFIVGAGGFDYLNGGAGSDMFFFSSPTDGGGSLSGDIIQDFASGVDRLGISGASFGLGSPGGATLESWRFVSGSNANLATTQFGYDSPSGHVWYDVDGTGAAGQIVLATLQPGATLTYSDFIVF